MIQQEELHIKQFTTGVTFYIFSDVIYNNLPENPSEYEGPFLSYVLFTDQNEIYSLNYFNSKTLTRINSLKPDIVNLHWVNNEMISIVEIANIKQPFVWTILDMWPFSGVEHYNQCSNYKKKKNVYISKILNNYILKRKNATFV